MGKIFNGSAGVLIGLLALTGCTGGNSEEAGPATTSSASTSPAATETAPVATEESTAEPTESPSTAAPTEEPTVEPSVEPSTAAPAPETAPPAPPAEEIPEATVFTTADGYYSFSMPSGWEAIAVQPPELPTYGMRISTTAYAIRNSDGQQIAKFVGGIPGDGAAITGPVHVAMDEAPTALADQFAQPVIFVFDHRPDHVTGDRLYAARLESGPVPENGIWGSQQNVVALETNGGVNFVSTLEPGRFKTEAEARAWMDSAEYQQLKSMMVSLQLHP